MLNLACETSCSLGPALTMRNTASTNLHIQSEHPARYTPAFNNIPPMATLLVRKRNI
jgi:hypothetical protein